MDKVKEWMTEALKWYEATKYNRLEQVCYQGHREVLKKLLKGEDLTFIISSRGSGRTYYTKYLGRIIHGQSKEDQ